MTEAVSERIVEQRIRNRIMDVVEMLSRSEDHVLTFGFGDYFELFYDWIPHRDDGIFPDLRTLSELETAALIKLSRKMDDACDATPNQMSGEDFVATNWPSHIEVIARETFDLMRERGRFDEEVEEAEPSKPA